MKSCPSSVLSFSITTFFLPNEAGSRLEIALKRGAHEKLDIGQAAVDIFADTTGGSSCETAVSKGRTVSKLNFISDFCILGKADQQSARL